MCTLHSLSSSPPDISFRLFSFPTFMVLPFPRYFNSFRAYHNRNALGDPHKKMSDILCRQFVAGSRYILETRWHYQVKILSYFF